MSGKFVSALILISLIAPSVLRANLGAPPYMSRGEVSERFLDLKNIRIDSEALVIDLRPLANPKESGGAIDVTAQYFILNSDSGRTIRVVFYSPEIRGDDDAFIELDGAQQHYTLQEYFHMSDSLSDSLGYHDLHERYTPLPGTHDSLFYSEGTSDFAYAMQLHIPHGEHTIRVRFSPSAEGARGHNVIFWQYAYLLSPARDWASFGTVRATILYPKDLLIAVEPKMSRHTDSVLYGEWSGPTYESVRLTMHAPEPLAWDRFIYEAFIFVLFIYLIKRIARWSRRKWLSFPVSIIGGIAFILLIDACEAIPGLRAGLQATPSYGYPSEIFTVPFAMFVVGCLYLWYATTGIPWEPPELEVDEDSSSALT